ncbi:unnamed protein product [Ophioblennius macclurei]
MKITDMTVVCMWLTVAMAAVALLGAEEVDEALGRNGTSTNHTTMGPDGVNATNLTTPAPPPAPTTTKGMATKSPETATTGAPGSATTPTGTAGSSNDTATTPGGGSASLRGSAAPLLLAAVSALVYSVRNV